MKKVYLFVFFCLIFVVVKSERPPAPVIQSVSVLNDLGNVRIKWLLNNPSEIDSIAIDRWLDPGTGFVFTEITRFNYEGIDFYDESLAPANTERCMYQVRCKNADEWSNSSDPPILTAFLYSEIEYVPCDLTNTIKWNEYDIKIPVDSYKIWSSIDGGTSFQLVDDVPVTNLTIIGTEAHLHWITLPTNIYQYTHQGIEADRIYHYKVEAITSQQLNDTVYSNIVEKSTPAYLQPPPPEVLNVSIMENNDVHITMAASDFNLINRFNLLRYEDLALPPTTYWIDPIVSSPFESIDSEADTELQSYFYQISVNDICDAPIDGIVPHRTIFLEPTLDATLIVNLEWNAYEGWNTLSQKVYRKIGGTEIPIATLSATELNYQDDISALTGSNGTFSYYVIAYGADPIQESRSNTISIQPDFEPIMPNAFNPNSDIEINRTFRPIAQFVFTNKYSMQIYDRWGAKIWETDNPTEGWTGSNASGELYPNGTYIYRLQYQNLNGPLESKQGTITLISGNN